MPTQLQLRRGTTSQNDAFTGAAGEVSVDTDMDDLRVHDGSTAGGFEVPSFGATGNLGVCGNTVPAASTVTWGVPANVVIRTNAHQGNVIIGDSTATSSYKLDVRGTANLASVTVNGAFTFPTVDGTEDYVMSTDGSGALSWVAGGEAIPVGIVIPYGAGTAPTGWLLCNDAAVDRTTYADLFTIIGTQFGAGNGSTTFNLPDMGDRMPMGKGTNNGTIGGETAGAAASAVVATASTTSSLTLTTGTFATSAKDSSTASALTNVTVAGHTHNLTIPMQVFEYIIKT